MTEDENEGASVAEFFDEFNRDEDKKVVIEEVHGKLCEVLTELAEDIVEAMAASSDAAAGSAQKEQPSAATADPGADGGATSKPAAEASADAADSGSGVDVVAAHAAYNDALAAIMREKDMTSKDVCALPDEHPLKELFFSAFDQQMFFDLLQRFIGQVRSRKDGPGEWDAEAAEGECDEDHTLE